MTFFKGNYSLHSPENGIPQFYYELGDGGGRFLIADASDGQHYVDRAGGRFFAAVHGTFSIKGTRADLDAYLAFKDRLH